MGIIKALFGGGGTAFNRLAKALKEVYDNVNSYNLSHNIEYLYKAAWIMKYGVYNSIEKWNWNMSSKIFIPDYQVLGRIPLTQAMLIAIGKISKAKENLPSEENEYIEQILEGGKAYYDTIKFIPMDLKNKLNP